MGANAAALIVTYVLVFRPLNYPDATRLVMVERVRDVRGPVAHQWSYPAIARLAQHATVLETVGLVAQHDVTLQHGTHGVHAVAEFASRGYFDVLGARPEAGRLFRPTSLETTPSVGGSPEVVVSARLLHDQPGLGLDSLIWVNGVRLQIVGILPAQFRGLEPTATLWIPIDEAPLVYGVPQMLTDNVWWLDCIARLRGRVTVQAVGSQLARAPLAGGYVAQAVALASTVTDPKVARLSLALFAAAAFVFVVACLNTAALRYAELEGRTNEILLRMQLGATPLRVLRHLTAEHVLDAAAAGAVAAGVTWLGLQALFRTPMVVGAHAPVDFARIAGRPAAWLAAAALSVGAALLLLTLTGTAHLVAIARQPSRPVVRRVAHHRTTLVVVQLAACVACIAGAATMTGSWHAVSDHFRWPGADRVLTFRIGLADQQDTNRAQSQFMAVDADLASLPGVQQAAIASTVPFARPPEQTSVIGVDGQAQLINMVAVTPGYFSAIGVRLITGTDFPRETTTRDAPVTIVSRAAAQRLFGTPNVLGRQVPNLMVPAAGGWVHPRVVGVAADTPYGRADDPPAPVLYVPIMQSYVASVYGILRRAGPGIVLPDRVIAQRTQQAGDAASAYDFLSLSARIERAVERERFGAEMFGAFGVLTAYLALMGVFGLGHLLALRRRREIAIRLALGASPSMLVRRVLREVMLVGLAGIAGGLVLATALNRVLDALIPGLVPMSWTLFGGANGVLLLGVLIATWRPAAASVNLDAMATLRSP